MKNRVAQCFDFYYALPDVRKGGFYEENTVNFSFDSAVCL